MVTLSQKIDQAIKEENENLSIHLFAISISEILINSYGTHNIEAFNMTLKAMIQIYQDKEQELQDLQRDAEKELGIK